MTINVKPSTKGVIMDNLKYWMDLQTIQALIDDIIKAGSPDQLDRLHSLLVAKNQKIASTITNPK
jgi:hypothetical protein